MSAEQFQIELRQIYSTSHLDSQCFSVGGRIDCQAVEFYSKWMKLEAGSIPGVSSHFLHNFRQFQMDLRQIYIDSHLDS